jgi:magnesium chelatase family protein
VDFSEVNGQPYLRRAAEIAASGMHNMLMVGPPGAGKTMISERISTILPPLTESEQLEVSKIYSVCGLLREQGCLVEKRPFRSPHHTISSVGLSGGGPRLRPGEISLAHHGVLFLDELTEFAKSTLEILRQPLEEREIHLVRASGSVTYPAEFLLLASMNPCNCGYYPDRNRCRCTEASLRRYFDRVSQPLIDRMDLCVQAPHVSYGELTGVQENEDSATIRARVICCHEIQQRRFADEPFSHNSRIPAGKLHKYCALGEKQQRYMEKMYQKMMLTARTYHKVLRVARTIADLDQSEEIRLSDLQEAVCYRELDARFWGGGA